TWTYLEGNRRRFVVTPVLPGTDDRPESPYYFFVGYPFHTSSLVTYERGEYEPQSVGLNIAPNAPIVLLCSDSQIRGAVEDKLIGLGYGVYDKERLDALAEEVEGLEGFPS